MVDPVSSQFHDAVFAGRPSIDRNVTPVGQAHPETSKDAATGAFLKSGTKRRAVYDLIDAAGYDGLTDKEIEAVTGGSHESISACRCSLSKDGHVADSGERRPTPSGNPAIVWVTARHRLTEPPLF